MSYGVHLIAAVGLSGQIGLNGKVPWHGDPKYADETARDLSEFGQLTQGGVLVLGSITAMGLPDGFKAKGRVLAQWHRSYRPDVFLEDLRRRYPQRNIWICGGAQVYEIFIPFVDWHHISVIPYDGPADAYMTPIIPGWIYPWQKRT